MDETATGSRMRMTDSRRPFDAPAAMTAARPIAVILPRREVFQSRGAGAVSLCVHDITRHSLYRRRTLILGDPVGEALDPERFVPVTPASWLYGRRTRRYLRGVIKALGERPPALIEIHNRPVYVEALRAAFPQVPLLLYIHNDPRTMRGLAGRRQRARALEVVTGVVCVSEYIRGCMLEGLEGHPNSSKVHVVLNGVDTTVLTPSEHKRREMVFVGRLSPQKGGLVFARAALALKDRLPGWRFILVGTRRFGDPSLESDYERQVAEAMGGLGPQGELTGYLPRAQATARLRQAAIAVMPAQWDDPCPLTIIEALASGCALATTPRGGIPEIVDGTGLLIESGDTATWAEKLLHLAGDADLQRRLQVAARRRATAVLDIRRCSARLDELRDRILHGEAGR